MNDKKLMNLAADNIRILAASMVEKANSGHPGGAMGGADFVNVLFSEFLVYDPETVSYTHLRAHETGRNLVCRLLLEKKKNNTSIRPVNQLYSLKKKKR